MEGVSLEVIASATLVNLDFDARVPVPFSIFPSSYKNNESTETTEVKSDERITVQGAGRDNERYREDVRITEEERRRPEHRVRREEEIRIHEGDRRDHRDRRDTRVEFEREHYEEPYRRYTDAQIQVEDRVYDREHPRGEVRENQLDITERDYRARVRPSEWHDKSTYPRDVYEDAEGRFEEKVKVRETHTFEGPEHKHKLDMGYYDDEGHYHSFRHGVERAAEKVLHPFHESRHHHHHHHDRRDREEVVIEDREIKVSAPRREHEHEHETRRPSRMSANTITIPCHHIRVGDLVILQGRPCQVVRITTSAQTGQLRYLGLDVLDKVLREESSFTSNPSPSVYVQNMLGPVFKQYRVLDIRDDGKIVAMTETGDIKQGLPVLDQSKLLRRITNAYDSGRGSVRVLVISHHGEELITDYRVIHGSRL